MTFSDDLKRFALKVETQNKAIFAGVVDLTHQSIQLGSPVTGAPGQPVDTGNLRASWQKTYESPSVALITTSVEYAKSIEDGLSYAHGGKPMTLRSPVGGFHSVALTRAGFQRIVEYVTKQVTGGK